MREIRRLGGGDKAQTFVVSNMVRPGKPGHGCGRPEEGCRALPECWSLRFAKSELFGTLQNWEAN